MGWFDLQLELEWWQWVLLGVLVALALAGLWYVVLWLRGYRCLPLTTTDCPGGKPHHLVYVDDFELAALAKIAKHTGKPCHGIRSYPPKPKRRKVVDRVQEEEREHPEFAKARQDAEEAARHPCKDEAPNVIRCETGCDQREDELVYDEIPDGKGACWGKTCMMTDTIAKDQRRQLNQGQTQISNPLLPGQGARAPVTHDELQRCADAEAFEDEEEKQEEDEEENNGAMVEMLQAATDDYFNLEGHMVYYYTDQGIGRFARAGPYTMLERTQNPNVYDVHVHLDSLYYPTIRISRIGGVLIPGTGPPHRLDQWWNYYDGQLGDWMIPAPGTDNTDTFSDDEFFHV